MIVPHAFAFIKTIMKETINYIVKGPSNVKTSRSRDLNTTTTTTTTTSTKTKTTTSTTPTVYTF